MEQNDGPNNLLQFPKKKEAGHTTPPLAPIDAPKKEQVAPKSKKSKSTLAGAVLAIILATGASNRYAFQAHGQSGSTSASSASRAIASVERVNWSRDAHWEKQLAESLASSQVREIASIGIGHDATLDEKLRWGTLEQKYTIVYRPEASLIQTIELQDVTTSPSYVLDRGEFLSQYGRLLATNFKSAKLKSVEMSHDKTIELYTIYDKDQRPKGEAHFELDKHKRLLSLKVEPTTI